MTPIESQSARDTVCTCPSGDGSLRWPCPVHPKPQGPVVDIWQEYECPVWGADSDIGSADILVAGGRFYCHWCGQTHTAQEAGITSTMVRLSGCDCICEERGLPADDAEKARWLAEIVEGVQ